MPSDTISQWRDSIIAKSQLHSETEVNDYVALTGTKLCLAAGLPLTMRAILLFGITALNQLPKTVEQVVLDQLCPIPAKSISRNERKCPTIPS